MPSLTTSRKDKIMTYFNFTSCVQEPSHPLKKQGDSYKNSRFLLTVGASVLVLGLLLYPESAQATNIDESLARVQGTLNGPLLKAGLTGATVVGTVMAAVKHSIGMALAVMGVGVALSIYMTWLNAHNFGG